MHNKFCIFDNKIISTGSFNPTYNDNYKNNNNLIIIESDYLAINYESEFEELWNLQFGKGEKVKYKKIDYGNITITNLFCPEDLCAENVINELENSNKSIYFMLFSFTDEDVANKLIEKSKSIDIKGVMEKQRITMELNQYKNLKQNNINVRVDSNPKFLHHKVFIIDNETVITGSYNPTGAGTKSNDENVLIIKSKDVANLYLKEFEKIWNISK